MGTYQIHQRCREHPLNPINPKKVHVSFVSWCVFAGHSKPPYFFIFSRTRFRGCQTLWDTCFIATFWDHVFCINVMGHMFYINIMGLRVLYERYETPCFISTLREKLHCFLSGRHESHILYVNIILAFNINTDFLKKSWNAIVCIIKWQM